MFVWKAAKQEFIDDKDDDEPHLAAQGING